MNKFTFELLRNCASKLAFELLRNCASKLAFELLRNSVCLDGLRHRAGEGR